MVWQLYLLLKKGLVFRFFRKRKLQRKIQLEDTLKQAFRLNERGNLSLPALVEKLGLKKSVLNGHLQTLKNQGIINFNKGNVSLTEKGATEATKLVRAHRLWETYLVNKIGLTEEQIHEDAEKYEHLLTQELLDEVDETLGFPTEDPHGSPIPIKLGIPDFPLIKLKILEQAKIAQQQLDEHITSELWKLGLSPNTVFTIKGSNENHIEVEYNGKIVKLSKSLARRVNIEQ